MILYLFKHLSIAIVFNFQLLVLITYFIATQALYSDDLGYNPFILKYDKINYDKNIVHSSHSRVKRSLDKYFYLNFNSHGKNFKLKLTPTTKTSYHNNVVEINSEKTKHNIDDLLTFYEGILVDEPDTSHVSGSVIDGVFYGTIKSENHGKFFIEPSKRYNHTLDAHSIIYHEEDIVLNKDKIKERAKRGANTNGEQNSTDNNDVLGCGSSTDKVKKWMKEEQEALFKERQKTQGFDPFIYLEGENNKKFNKYSREANEKYKKRDTEQQQDPKRLEFDDKRTICNLYLRVDPQLHNEIFNNEGNRDSDKTTTFLLFYLNKHVEALNTIYNSLPFYDPAKESYYIGLQFMIYRTKIITEEQCRNKTVLSSEELKLCEPYLDVSTFLNYVSLDNFTDYCLSYTFTARDFTDGTLGLAWVAKLAGSVGGVCERRQTLQGVAKSLNSGIVTVVNYQARVPEAVSQITFAHEVGHNFGSEHDPDDSMCSPGASKGGNYIMYRRATTGTDRNNRNFSQCSRDQMGPIVHALVKNRAKFCFKQFSGSLCGNGIVEEGEECDCGYGTDCKESCCIDASQDTNKCKLKPGKQCSPSQGPCCDNSCSFASNKTICMQSNECLNNVSCTGKNATCPRFNPTFYKPDKTECNSGTQVCKAGVCSGSICEKYEMEQCFLEGNLKDKKQDKAVLCHLACSGAQTDYKCVDSFDIPIMNATKGLILKPGSPCIGTLGYCDIFSKCRSVDGEGPLSRLKNLILNPVTLSSIRQWITTYWWAASLIVLGLLLFMIVFIKVCSVHTPSSNPRKPPALKISETLRRPIRKLPHLPHLHHHHDQPSANGQPTQKTSSSRHTGAQAHLINEKYAKNSKQKGSSSQSNGAVSNHKKPTSSSAAAKSAKKIKETTSNGHHSKHESSSSSNKKDEKKYKKHKGNEQYHYYNNNHPLHPMPHKSSHSNTSGQAQHQQANGKKHKTDEGRNRSKSEDPHHSHSSSSQHNHRSEHGKRSRSNHDEHKKKPKVSKSSSPTKYYKSDNVNKKSSDVNKQTKHHSKSKNIKRSSTESSNVDA